MRIKIIKASKNSYWYANEIDRIYEVCGVDKDVFRVEKWIKDDTNPFASVIAPVLKADCEELPFESTSPEPRRKRDWRARTFKADRVKQLEERSGFRTGQEIEHYERLNKEADMTVYKISSKETDNQ